MASSSFLSRCRAGQRRDTVRMHESVARRVMHAGADVDGGKGTLLQIDLDPVALGEGELALAVQRDRARGYGGPMRLACLQTAPAQNADVAHIAGGDGRMEHQR